MIVYLLTYTREWVRRFPRFTDSIPLFPMSLPTQIMTKFQLLLRSLLHHRWLNLAVLLAVAVATVALTAALIVGDSVRGSLSQLMIDQLGPIDLLLLNERFFDPALADPALTRAAQQESSDHNVQVACILPEITIEVQNQRRRSRGVFLSAWEDNELQIQRDEIVINAALARELDVQVGDQLVSVNWEKQSLKHALVKLADKYDLAYDVPSWGHLVVRKQTVKTEKSEH